MIRPEVGGCLWSRELGKVWTRCGTAPRTRENPVFHSLVLLGDLKSPREANPWSPLTARDRGRAAPGAGDSHSVPEPLGIALRSQPDAWFPEEARSPLPEEQINALSCLQRICALKTSSQGLPGFGLGSAFTFPSRPLPSVLPHTPNLVILQGFSMQNANFVPALALQVPDLPPMSKPAVTKPHKTKTKHKPNPKTLPEPNSPAQKGTHM